MNNDFFDMVTFFPELKSNEDPLEAELRIVGLLADSNAVAARCAMLKHLADTLESPIDWPTPDEFLTELDAVFEHGIAGALDAGKVNLQQLLHMSRIPDVLQALHDAAREAPRTRVFDSEDNLIHASRVHRYAQANLSAAGGDAPSEPHGRPVVFRWLLGETQVRFVCSSEIRELNGGKLPDQLELRVFPGKIENDALLRSSTGESYQLTIKQAGRLLEIGWREFDNACGGDVCLPPVLVANGQEVTAVCEVVNGDD